MTIRPTSFTAAFAFVYSSVFAQPVSGLPLAKTDEKPFPVTISKQFTASVGDAGCKLTVVGEVTLAHASRVSLVKSPDQGFPGHKKNANDLFLDLAIVWMKGPNLPNYEKPFKVTFPVMSSDMKTRFCDLKTVHIAGEGMETQEVVVKHQF
jgi:hypothetical protein